MSRSIFTIVLAWALAAPVGAQGDSAPAARPWLERARQVGWWLRSLEARDGMVPVDALTPDAQRVDLASGQAGQLLFWLSLHRATGEREASAALERVARALAAKLPAQLDLDAFPPETGLYYGLAGVAWTLDLAGREMGDPEIADAARRATRLLMDSARLDGDARPYWDARYDELLFGNSGTALFMIYAATEMGIDEAMGLARAQGDRLITLARRDRGGLGWPMRRDRPELELPNFSHGAAGIGYFLATLSMATGEPRYLVAAQQAADHLLAIARHDLGGVTFPYGFGNPEWNGVVGIDWAHGVAGSARLFERLYQMTGDARAKATVLDCAAAIGRSNVPYEATRGFDGAWALDRRFGMTGVAEFLVARYRRDGDQLLLAQADDIARHIYEAALPEELGLVWESPRPALSQRPGEPARLTGYLTGAIGHGLLFLQLDAAMTGSLDPVPRLDDPYAFVPVSSP